MSVNNDANVCWIVGVADDLPALCGHRGGHGECQRLPPAVDEHHEVVVELWCAVLAAVGIGGAVDARRDAAGQWIRPIPIRHLITGHVEPAQVVCGGSVGKSPPSEDGVAV